MDKIERIAGSAPTRLAMESFAANLDQIVHSIISIQQIPAPTFHESARAEYIEARFKQLGLQDVGCDTLHNVFGRIPGLRPGTHRPVIISAHSDTVFPAGTDLQVHWQGDRLYGPGIGDNSSGVAGLFTIAEALRHFNLRTNSDLWFVSNVGEEGMGDLRGMRAVVERFGRQASYIVVEGGLFGQISHEAIGVRRYQVDVQTPGGHSWGSFGQPSAIHELGKLIAAISRIQVPASPKTVYNIGVVSGGTSVNTIASSASMLVDLRSAEDAELARLINQVSAIVGRAQKHNARRKNGVEISMKPVGNRPAGAVPRETPLVVWAERALKQVGQPYVTYVSGSTDANIPLSLGVPSVCVGLCVSANSHRTDEYIEIANLPYGLQHLLLLVLAAGDFRGQD